MLNQRKPSKQSVGINHYRMQSVLKLEHAHTIISGQDAYQILGVPVNATKEEITAAYLALQAELNTLKFSPQIGSLQIKLNGAYLRLRDTTKHHTPSTTSTRIQSVELVNPPAINPNYVDEKTHGVTPVADSRLTLNPSAPPLELLAETKTTLSTTAVISLMQLEQKKLKPATPNSKLLSYLPVPIKDENLPPAYPGNVLDQINVGYPLYDDEPPSYTSAHPGAATKHAAP